MTPSTRPHYQEIADLYTAMTLKAKQGNEDAINALCKLENDSNGEPVNGWIFWTVVAALIVAFWVPWAVGAMHLYGLMVQP